ncbi:iron(III)/spermidine/putrescine ABC transporter, ATP-binding protein [Campylobacter mucosalis]|uniref:Putative iron(III) ABC transporter, ATP-binding protein n=1 Tax=Campylobacter mucosalis CCUG 21559 TaxID=1032067 RepID=A0A6G5QIT5_9BACT|nr:ABC transporter ATP-binding protein [Campylobacter mucosalis]QCD45571.1 putative iron(III) ABC transporter, ATP-binding protein [Campylobacter mucosalis CCUG 21559]QKF63761.1 iron(III)/spermidine/putrescine ABC transporter, ATP-binding protein [Campylobacter mucosalis]
MSEILKISNLNKNFGKQSVLKDVSLALNEGEILTILGESGCGKSTLLRIIAGLENKDSGELKINCGVAMMFQNYALFPHLNVYENIEFALLKTPKNQRASITKELLGKFKIEAIKDKMCDQISGGQAQRVAFARAVANKEKLLLLDEPFANLDHNLRNVLRAELKDMIKQNALSAIMVTHDKQDAFLISDKIALIKNGVILANDTPKQLYFNPSSYEIASFLGDINLVSDVETLPDEFKAWIKQHNFMFRPEQIVIGNRYKAKVLKADFLGSFYELFLEFGGLKFKAIVPSNLDINDEFGFDFLK